MAQEQQDIWEKIVAGDREAFDRLVEQEMANLLEAARHEIAYYESIGDYPPDYITPEELVAEAMIRAWDNREKKPKGMEPRAWLFAMLFRAADALAARRRDIQRHETLPLEQKIPDVPLVNDPVYDDDEEFYEWYQPDEALKWEDVIGNIDLEPDLLMEAVEAAPKRLEPKERRAAMLYCRFGLSLEQTCRVLEEKPEVVTQLVEKAKEKVQAGN